MDEIKIKNFIVAHPGVSLPKFHHVQPDECESLRVAMSKKMGLAATATGLELLNSIEKRAPPIPNVIPSDESFRPARLLHEKKIEAEQIYINWYQFDDIDEMALGEFSISFHDLWYPASDDIELFDQSLEWILLVRHFDVVQFARL
ncbi:MAG: hypothetical protein JWN74_2726 [Acidobacteriaceae bacterium]|nr:hypothetical protein [Acidobacteriaceae bacterium]